ncbi:unnamed protein product [Cylicocyclus nassatus]|uniref:Uncharacterized protein n=1 Tax=Cylicocyclus nassatus TaxID=53992 RepID=A0AA36DQ46_CYLNA|nr:unnamed protein product [Cylicocyclus nassatus]
MSMIAVFYANARRTWKTLNHLDYLESNTTHIFQCKRRKHTLSNVKPAMQTLSNVKTRAAPARTELYVSDTSPQQTTPGNVYNRPELDFDTTEERDAPSSLYDCIVVGTLNMKEAAQLILDQKRNGQFNKSIYDEFVRSEAASRVQNFCFDGLLDLDDAVLEMRLCNLANSLLGQIQCAKLDRSNRMIELTGRELSGVGSKPTISLRNCVRIWNIEGPPPFITTPMEELIENYKPKGSNNLFQMFACFYRFLVMRITDPPHRIQSYSLRLNGKRGRKDSLENLPRHIEHLLLDFVEDLIGFGHNELKSGARANTTHSKYVLSLGNTDAERQAALDAKVQTRMVYRNELFKALQLALRDVRTYTYDESKKVWIAGDRKLKRAKLDASINLREALEDSMNLTEAYDQENLVPASQ